MSSSGQPDIPADDIRRARGAWTELWVPCVIFAHIFALTWLLMAFFKMNPQHAATLRRCATWAWARTRKREREQQAKPPPLKGASAAPAQAPSADVSEAVDLRQRRLAPLAVPPNGAQDVNGGGAALAPAGPNDAASTAAPPPPRPDAAAAATLAHDAVSGVSGRRPWTPPLPSLPPSEPGSAMTRGSHPEAASAADAVGNFRPAAAAAEALRQPVHVERRWTALGVPKADKGVAAAPGGPAAAAGLAADGAADAGAAVAAAPAAVGGGVRRRTVTMHHKVTEADLAKSGKAVRLDELAEAAGAFVPTRPVSRQTREIMNALAAQGAAPDLRVVRRVSSNVRRICIEWLDLGCEYDTSSGPKTVLKGVYGRAVPGDLLGLLGPSGAGKSTLLDVLAARKRVGRLSGQVLVDGRPRDDNAFVRRSAYVPQDDHFIPTLSAWEVITFHASLVLPAATSPTGRRKRCTEVLAAMGLGRQGSTLVGGTLPGGLVLRGLSGGERKRLAIATGIVAAPSALLLDEPTSGLDAAAALGVMQYMHALAQAGHVVLASVHQPRAAIWSMFTQVVVLSRGRMMYSGDRADAVPWFTSGLGYMYDPQRHGVASDWIMDLVNTTFKKPRRIYGRMMTTASDVDAAADAFLRRYKDLRQQRLYDEHGEQTQLSYDSHPPSVDVAGRRAASSPTPGGDDALPLYDSVDHARAAAAAAASSGTPTHSLDLTTSMLAHRGSAEGPASAVGAQRSREAAAAAAPPPPPPPGTDSITANVGSPALLPATPRSTSLVSSGGGAAAAGGPALATGGGGGGGGGDSFDRGPSGRSSSGGGGVHFAGSSFGRGASYRSAATAATAATAAAAGDDSAPGPSPFSDATHAALVDTHSSLPASVAAPRRGILRTATPPRGSYGTAAAADDGAGAGAAGASAATALADAAAKAVAQAEAWHVGPEGQGRRLRVAKDREVRRLARLGAPPGWLAQVRVLTWRELAAMTRNPADVAGRMLIFCWIALVVGIIFYSVGDYFEAIRSRLDVMYIETCVLMLLPYVYMSLYTADKLYYTADLSAKLYSPSAYYTAKVLAVLPFGVMSMLVFSFTIYGMSGLRRSGTALAEHGLLACLAYLNASQVLYAAAVATPNQDTAFMVAIAWTAVNILMSNYLIRYDDMSQMWLTKILRWFSVMMWTFQGMASAEYRDQYYSCSGGFGTSVLSSLAAYLPGTRAVGFASTILGTPDPDCAVSTNKILDYFGMDQPFWRLAVILVGYLGVLHVITFAALRLTAGRERR
ncbi:hypothetical protein PLESTB_000524500 [Pleodorina starrii]|uniref:ABC transporter domain-containing protein n=1 Tax=Pleodorina starrii TaxID=330485 RepID=A0A9W6F020_9CHLO|nr:hypothetical protein PLESTM_000387900 [Pleodorina starrii]GLC51643.1 hypothetical protein PLESTB_000524500 [Pleodorina starrii]GLC72411.1 hypothetical protein PLESTF_001244800 [Pleodorina starrii]